MFRIGMDVSKGRSTVFVLTTFDEAVHLSYEITHKESEMKGLNHVFYEIPAKIRQMAEGYRE